MISCKKTSEGESVAIWQKVYKVEIVKFEKDLFSGRLIKKEECKEFTAENDCIAAQNGFITYLANIKTFAKLHSNGHWISIPHFYSVYDENGRIISRIKGDEKQRLIKMALTDDDIQAYKKCLPTYHFEYSALMQE